VPLSIAPAEGFPAAWAQERARLWRSCSRSFRHPIAGALQKAHGHGFASFVILQGVDGGLGLRPLRSGLESYPVAKLQRQRRNKNRVMRAAVLDNGRLPQIRDAVPRRSYVHGDTHGAGLGEKARQPLRATLFLRDQLRTAVSPHFASRLALLSAFCRGRDTPLARPGAN